MTAPWEIPCPHQACTHAQCPEQQRLAAEVERLRHELEKRTRRCVHCADLVEHAGDELVHVDNGTRYCDSPDAGFTTEAA